MAVSGTVSSVYIASPEGDTGKSTVALGVLQMLCASTARVGVFRPIARAADQTDHILELLIEHTTADLSYEQCLGVTYEQVHADPDGALSDIVSRYHEVAADYFTKALFVDLCDLHGNTVDGLHIASAGGVWTALVNGFGGMRDHGGRLSFDPRLPDGWPALSFSLRWHGSRLRVRVEPERVGAAGRGRFGGDARAA